MNEKPIPEPKCEQCPAVSNNPTIVSRRTFLTRLSLTLGGVCAAVIGIPTTAFVLAPLFRRAAGVWRPIGPVDNFVIGQTVTVTFEDPSPLPWAGVTAKAAAWLRRESADTFIAFSAHCTHLGCPVRWMPEANLFLCPCHGGVYYADGGVAAGPPPLPLIRYEVRQRNGKVEIKATAIPITTTL
jgi:menaquinol-cytochrome c reductase iron-sulfur subunit